MLRLARPTRACACRGHYAWPSADAANARRADAARNSDETCLPPPQTPPLKDLINGLARKSAVMGYVFAKDSEMTADVAHRRPEEMTPESLVDLGALRGLIYSADRDGDGVAKTFIHFMETPPRLMYDLRGSQLYIVGGRYRVTRRGIEG
ncbi:MAG: hypothetical protein ACREA2_08520 [Blastocatellia bacterium]